MNPGPGHTSFGHRLPEGFFVLDCPGPTPPDMRSLPFRVVKWPIFPRMTSTTRNDGLEVETEPSV